MKKEKYKLLQKGKDKRIFERTNVSLPYVDKEILSNNTKKIRKFFDNVKKSKYK